MPNPSAEDLQQMTRREIGEQQDYGRLESQSSSSARRASFATAWVTAHGLFKSTGQRVQLWHLVRNGKDFIMAHRHLGSNESSRPTNASEVREGTGAIRPTHLHCADAASARLRVQIDIDVLIDAGTSPDGRSVYEAVRPHVIPRSTTATSTAAEHLLKRGAPLTLIPTPPWDAGRILNALPVCDT